MRGLQWLDPLVFRRSVLLLYGVALLGGCAPFPNRHADHGFAERYLAYQGYARTGYTAINNHDYIAAIDQYTKVIEISPFVASHYYYRGLAWYKKGNEEKAMEDFNKVVILDARWVPAYVYRGLIRMNRMEYSQALSDYTLALNMNGQDPTVHNNLAWFYATAKDKKFQDKDKSLEHAKKAAELSKESNAEILDTLAQSYFINGKIQEALKTAQKAVRLDTHNQGFKGHLAVYQKALQEDEMNSTTAGSQLKTE